MKFQMDLYLKCGKCGVKTDVVEWSYCYGDDFHDILEYLNDKVGAIVNPAERQGWTMDPSSDGDWALCPDCAKPVKDKKEEEEAEEETRNARRELDKILQAHPELRSVL